MTKHSVAEQTQALRVMAEFAAEHPTLPAPRISFEDVYASGGMRFGVRVATTDGFGEFEQWREALGIRPETVAHSLQRRERRLEADTVLGGVPVHLVAYAPLYVSPALAVVA